MNEDVGVMYIKVSSIVKMLKGRIKTKINLIGRNGVLKLIRCNLIEINKKR